MSVGPRTRVFATYSDRLTTSARRGTDLLNTAGLDQTGYPGDADGSFYPGSNSGQFNSNPFLAVQGGLIRLKRAAASVTRTFTRDTVTLSVFREEQEPISATVGTTVFAQRGTSGSLAWARELTPEMTAIAYIQYGTYSSPTFRTTNTGSSGTTGTASASLVRRFTPRLSGSLQYAISRRDPGGDQGASIQNLVLVSLRQDF